MKLLHWKLFRLQWTICQFSIFETFKLRILQAAVDNFLIFKIWKFRLQWWTSTQATTLLGRVFSGLVNIIGAEHLHLHYLKIKHDLIRKQILKQSENSSFCPPIHHICHFYYTNTFLKPVRITPKVRKFATKISSRQYSVNLLS